MSNNITAPVTTSGNSISAPITLGYSGPAGSGTLWYVDSGVPSSGLGNNNDLYLNSGNADVYQKISGSWSLVLNISGPSGGYASINHTHTLSDITDAGSMASQSSGNYYTQSAINSLLTGKLNVTGQAADSALLAGQGSNFYRNYSNLTGTPNTGLFAPSGHSHTASDVTDFGVSVDSRVTGSNYSIGKPWFFNSGIRFSVDAPAPVHTPGLLFYNSTNGHLSFFNAEEDVTMNIGQETWVRVRNNSGGTITNGSVVYTNGAVGSTPTVALARADSLLTSEVLGIATHDIENNSFGYVTVLGIVNDIDTSSWGAGTELFLSPDTAGGVTSTIPTGENLIVPLGYVLTSNPSNGSAHFDLHPYPQPADLTEALKNEIIFGRWTFNSGINTDSINGSGLNFEAWNSALPSTGTAANSTLLNSQSGAYYLNYNNFTNIPSSFNPSAHTHTLSEITDAGTMAAEGTGDYYDRTLIDGFLTGKLDVTGIAANSNLLSGQNSAYYLNYNNLLNKPTGFTPVSHTHTLDEITDAGNLASINYPGGTSTFLRADGTFATPPAQTGDGLAWGSITGTLSSQTDLWSVLTAKLSATGQAADSLLLNGEAASFYRNYANITGTPDTGNFAPASHTHTLSDISDAGTMAAQSASNYYTSSSVDSLLTGKLSATGQAADSALLNGQAASYYRNYNNLTGAPGYLNGSQIFGKSTITGNTTLTSGDAGKLIRMQGASSITITINSGVHAENDIITFLNRSSSTGYFSAGAGVTFDGSTGIAPSGMAQVLCWSEGSGAANDEFELL